MDTARADALAARHQLDAKGWIPRKSEHFRHLPPPEAAWWLGERAEGAGAGCDAAPLAGAGWTLNPIGDLAGGDAARAPRPDVDARWLDATDATQRAELFAGLPAPGDDDAAAFAWAHRALVRQGLRLRIGAGAQAPAAAPTALLLRHQPRTAVEAPLLVIDVQPGAQVVLIESHERGSAEPAGQACQRALVQNLQVHLRLGEGASLLHLRLALPGADDRLAHHLQVRLARQARYEQALLAAGSVYHLQRQAFALEGAHAVARTGAVLLASGNAVELQARVAHAAAHTRSAVEALALAGGAAQAVVNAHGRIDPGCDEAEVRQRLSAVPTAGQPRLVLRPHLEILHDQVQAAHGATWGALPEEALFHARQRGLDERTAQAMILEGMAQAVLARAIESPERLAALGMEAALSQAVARHLAGAPAPTTPTPAEARHG